jgi:hypothetical protein
LGEIVGPDERHPTRIPEAQIKANEVVTEEVFPRARSLQEPLGFLVTSLFKKRCASGWQTQNSVPTRLCNKRTCDRQQASRNPKKPGKGALNPERKAQEPDQQYEGE